MSISSHLQSVQH
ncbi:UNVERIFIED_CONTAM: hypothetical protein GTU68_012823 [Idotea baltica]|nr:hypothetical protein [Idotea baltica]